MLHTKEMGLIGTHKKDIFPLHLLVNKQSIQSSFDSIMT